MQTRQINVLERIGFAVMKIIVYRVAMGRKLDCRKRCAAGDEHIAVSESQMAVKRGCEDPPKNLCFHF